MLHLSGQLHTTMATWLVATPHIFVRSCKGRSSQLLTKLQFHDNPIPHLYERHVLQGLRQPGSAVALFLVMQDIYLLWR